MQQGMLFHTLYAPQAGVYVDQQACLLRGALDLAAFERAWQEVVALHPVLRTAFIWEGLKEPIQTVHRSARVSVAHHDWTELSAEEQRGAARRTRAREPAARLRPRLAAADAHRADEGGRRDAPTASGAATT